MTQSIEHLIRYWEGLGIGIAKGCSRSEIDVFERRHGVKLPADFVALYSTVIGMNPSNPYDTRMFSFLPLQDLQVIDVKEPDEAGDGKIVVFIDYFIG